MKTAVKNEIWKKNWAANWGLLICSLFSPIYPIKTKNALGKGIKKAVLIYEKGSSSNYLPEKDTLDFGKYLAKKIAARPSLAKEWVKKVIAETDRYLKLLARLEKCKKFNLSDFEAFEQGVYSHVPPNLAVKKVADFLPEKLLNGLLPDFEKARIYTEDVYNQVDKIGKSFQSFIARQSGLPKKLALLLTKEEIKKYFEHQTLPNRKILLARTGGVLIYTTDGGQKIYTNKQKNRFQKLLFKPVNRRNLKGTPAYKGVAQGLARIVLDPKNAHNFNTGDILVTGMTRPEFLPLMKKAAGFVTDAGGMLSHAAIVARELKKPCIVGTEIATKIFKDGDKVSVDANRGIVKKI